MCGRMYARYRLSDAYCDTERFSEVQRDSCSAQQVSRSSRDLRFRVLRLPAAKPRLSHRAIADALGVSAGGVDYCVSAQIKVAAIKIKSLCESTNKTLYTYFFGAQGPFGKVHFDERFSC